MLVERTVGGSGGVPKGVGLGEYIAPGIVGQGLGVAQVQTSQGQVLQSSRFQLSIVAGQRDARLQDLTPCFVVVGLSGRGAVTGVAGLDQPAEVVVDILGGVAVGVGHIPWYPWHDWCNGLARDAHQAK